ncbi:hypothetical protein LJC55_01060 [Eubacteriales bacterium OttesenSCG-928-N14]|nr:hypothetical protein [Eubacteriales bacterium OttesenSCG-928-N14]
MFRIDKKSVDYDNSAMTNVVIKPAVMPAVSPVAEDDIETVEAQEVEPEELSPEEIAEQIVAMAEQRAQVILDEANRTAEGIIADAYDTGYSEGMSQANAVLQQQSEEQLQEFQSAVDDIESFKAQVLSELEDNVLELALEVAKKIIHIELERDSTLFIGMVRQAIQRLRQEGKFTVKVNSQQFADCFSDGGKAFAQTIDSAPFTVVPDPGISPFGVVLEAQKGVVDAGADTQLKMVSRALDHEEAVDEQEY